VDTFAPKESYKEEVNALKDLLNFLYRNFLTLGHEGYKSQGKIWRDMLRESTKE